MVGWSITDQVETITFPSAMVIAPGESLYLTRNATAFELEMAIQADWEYHVDSTPDVPDITDGTLGLANAGNEVILKDASDNIVDVVIYGTSDYTGDGWSGGAVPTDSEGIITERDINETTGYYKDTDTAADWDDNRRYTVGQSHFPYETFSFSGKVTAFTSPDSSFNVVVSAIENATSSFYLNVYELTNLYLMDYIIDACDRGLDVRVFLEGSPAGMHDYERNAEKYIIQQIVNAGGQVRYIITDADNDIHDRYTYDHAKYALIDNNAVMVMSENWKNGSIHKDNTYGNRGWGILIENQDVAGYFLDVFMDDWNDKYRDVFPYTASDPKYGAPPPDYTENREVKSGNYVPYFDNQTFSGNFKVSSVLSPDTSLLETKSIIGMIKNAQKTVYVEQMYAHKHWGPKSTGSPETTPNLYLEAAIEAANEGAGVRILLGSAWIDYSDPRNNQATVDYVNGFANSPYNYNISAKLVDTSLTKFTKIHNKGVIVDGNKTLVCSINWGENSATNNREAGVNIENEEVAEFYTKVFMFDWDPVNNTPSDGELPAPDNDNDGIPDSEDPDDDNDGYNDTIENTEGTNPFDDTSKPADNDGDFIPDSTDEDDDNDDLTDAEEAELGTDPFKADTDGDGHIDSEDYYPKDKTRWEKEGDLTPYAVGGGVLAAIVGGTAYYIKKKKGGGKEDKPTKPRGKK